MGKKVLLADDSATIQKLVEMALSESGFELLAVSDGKRAVDLLSEFKPDIVLADAIMPVLDGYQVCRHVKENAAFRHVPVVLLTGRFQPFDEARARQAGIDLSLEKPFSQEVLVGTLNRLLSSRDAEGDTPEIQEEDTLDLDGVDDEGLSLDRGFDDDDENATVHMSPEDLRAHLEEVRARAASAASAQLPDFEDFEDTQPAPEIEDDEEEEPPELEDFDSEADTILISVGEDEREDEALELMPEDLEEIEEHREEEMVNGAFDTLPGSVKSKELIGEEEEAENEDRSWAGDEVNFEQVTEEMADAGQGIEEALGFETVAFTDLGDHGEDDEEAEPEEIDESDLAFEVEDDDEAVPAAPEDYNRTLPSPEFEGSEEAEGPDNISLDTYSTFEDEVLEDDPLELGPSDSPVAETAGTLDDSVDELSDVDLEEVDLEEVEDTDDTDSSGEYQLDWSEEDEEEPETPVEDGFSTIEAGGVQEADQDLIATEELDDLEDQEPDLSEEDFRLELGEELAAGLEVEEPPAEPADLDLEEPPRQEPDFLDTEPVEESALPAEDAEVDTEAMDLVAGEAEELALVGEDEEPLALDDDTEEPPDRAERQRVVFSDDLPEALERAELEALEDNTGQETEPEDEAAPEPPSVQESAAQPVGEEGVSMAAIAKLSERELDQLAEKVVARLVHKLGDGTVRDVVWQVVPELAEAMIKKRIFQLEQGVDQE